MKRLLVAVFCTFTFSAVGIGNVNERDIIDETLQEQKEVKPYDIYVGQYEVAPGFTLTVTNENNKLMGQPTGDAKIEFKPEAEADTFSSSQENVQLKFVKDETGVVAGVIVTLDGKPYPSKKIK